MHTPGPWREGKAGGSIVSDSREGLHKCEADCTCAEYYGGNVIAETVAPCNMPVIIAAPKMAALLLRAYTHVTHGGPTRGELEAVLKEAKLI